MKPGSELTEDYVHPEARSRIREEVPEWFRGSGWELLSLSARLNVAFADTHRKCGIHKKELWENREFFSKTRDVIRKHYDGEALEHLVDLGGGHGLAALLWLAYGEATRASIVDPHPPKAYSALLQHFLDVVEFASPAYVRKNLREAPLPSFPERSAVISLHCCGYFADEVIEQALALGVPFAVVPCCHEDKHPGIVEQLKLVAGRKGIEYSDVVDIYRLGKIRAAGWDFRYDTLSTEITPKNNVLIGLPPRR